MLGPSGTGKSVFLKHLVGLLKPTRGHVYVDGRDVPNLSEKDLYEVRKMFGVLFQDGALFGSMNIYDNVAFPLREHTKKSESDIKKIVNEKLEMTGLTGANDKLPGEISGGMKKRAGLARALVLDPEIMLFDEPDSGLDPVRVAYLNQLIVDLNAQIGATFLIVTHDIGTARTVPDNIGLLFKKNLVMFGPREQLLQSDEPVVRQFLNGRMEGPIGMAEEKDSAQVAEELERLEQRGGDKPMGAPGPKGASADGSSVKLLPSGQREEQEADAEGGSDTADKDGKRPADRDLGAAAGTRDDLPGLDEEVPADIAGEVAAIQAERIDVENSGGGQPLEPRTAFDPETGQQRKRPRDMSDEEYDQVFNRKEADEAKPEGAGSEAAEKVRTEAESKRESGDSDRTPGDDLDDEKDKQDTQDKQGDEARPKRRLGRHRAPGNDGADASASDKLARRRSAKSAPSPDDQVDS